MNTIKRVVGRSGSLLTALAFTVATIAPVVVSGTADAAQFTPRKLTMSSSARGNISTDANGATVNRGSGGNGAFANHAYNFSTGSANDVQSILIQYCTTPLLNTACTAPTGMDASTVTGFTHTGFGASAPVLDTTTVVTGGAGTIFATSPCVSRAHCITMTRPTGSIASGTALQLVYGSGGNASTNWIKNPTVDGTFYVRIYTFTNATYTEANIADSGAVAGAVDDQIDITAKVQEKLNFSVASAHVAPGTSCDPLTGTGALNLGDAQGVLDITVPYAANSYFRLNTNAAGGTNVLYSGDTLKTAGGTNSIASVGTTQTASTPGTAQFGLGLDSGDTGKHSFTNLVATAPYQSGNGTITAGGTARFAHDVASVTTPVQIAGVTNSTVSCDTGSVRYIGNVATTTRAGVYKTTITYIAVPTF